jgi:isoleucyl-tRNA synthetase
VVQWLEIERYALALMHKLQDEVRADYERYEFHLIAQKLQAFCSEALGGFYLDILKDRLYTAGADSLARRSAQNALYHITHALVRLMAPILSFTGEEVWAVLSGKDDVSVFEEQWYDLPAHALEQKLIDSWQTVREVRELANKAIEEKRAQNLLGSSLQAELDIYAFGASYEVLARLGDDLKFIFITSRATLHLRDGGGVGFDVAPSAHTKCDRCWHYREDVGSDAAHPTLCSRCVSNLYGSGEARRYA